MSSHARLLIIDDSPDNTHLLTHILQSVGYEHIDCLHNASLAEERVREFNPDLILLDLNMAGMDGFDVLSQLNQMMPPDGFLPVLVVTADHRVEARKRALALGATDFVLRPHQKFDIVLRVRNLLQTRFLHLEVLARNEMLESQVRERTLNLEESQVELKLAKIDVIERLAMVGEHHDDDTGAHTQRVGLLSEELAKRSGLSEEEVELIRRASPLHDVGKIGISDSILRKAGKLTQEEFNTMKKHCEIGARLLSNGRSDFLDMARIIALSHHERWNGSGYPYGLAGEEIPFAGRIVAVADVFDALTHERPYKRAWSIDEAVTEIKVQSGKQFDPKIVDILCQLDCEQFLG